MRVPAQPSVPRAGMLAAVRNRRGVVAGVEPFDGEAGRLHLVHLEYRDDHAPTEERLLWELEPSRHLLEPNALPDPARGGAMPAEDFDALLRAARWTALSPCLDFGGDGGGEEGPDGPPHRQPVASPFHGGVCIESYQLVPLLKALRMPRVSLLIADDVGLGKTIEAGLVLTELLLRRRIRRVLVLTPASLRRQWREELRDKFSLFDAFREQCARSYRRGRSRAGTFAVEIFGKRLLSCPTAFAESWGRTRQGFSEQDATVEKAGAGAVGVETARVEAAAADTVGAGTAGTGTTGAETARVETAEARTTGPDTASAEAELAAAERALRQETGDDREAQQREATAATVAGTWLKHFVDDVQEEIRGIEHALDALGFTLDGPPIVEQTPVADARFDALVDLIEHRLQAGGEFRTDECLIVFTEYKTTLDYLARPPRRLHRREAPPARERVAGWRRDRGAATAANAATAVPVPVAAAAHRPSSRSCWSRSAASMPPPARGRAAATSRPPRGGARSPARPSSPATCGRAGAAPACRCS